MGLSEKLPEGPSLDAIARSVAEFQCSFSNLIKEALRMTVVNNLIALEANEMCHAEQFETVVRMDVTCSMIGDIMPQQLIASLNSFFNQNIESITHPILDDEQRKNILDEFFCRLSIVFLQEHLSLIPVVLAKTGLTGINYHEFDLLLASMALSSKTQEIFGEELRKKLFGD